MTDTRETGLSGLVRLADEEAWCGLALASFIDWCDELIVVLNRCKDQTPAIVNDFAAKYKDKIRVFDYPHEIWPMGPGHDEIASDDIRASARLYNFTQGKARFSHAVKLDGDMVMMDWAGAYIRRLLREDDWDRIKFEGTDIVGNELTKIGNHPRCPTNGVYRLGEGVRYVQGPMTQSLLGVSENPYMVRNRAFLHFKWARKSFASATRQWPRNWDEIAHFQRIAERRHPVGPFNGEYPASVAALL